MNNPGINTLFAFLSTIRDGKTDIKLTFREYIEIQHQRADITEIEKEIRKGKAHYKPVKIRKEIENLPEGYEHNKKYSFPILEAIRLSKEEYWLDTISNKIIKYTEREDFNGKLPVTFSDICDAKNSGFGMVNRYLKFCRKHELIEVIETRKARGRYPSKLYGLTKGPNSGSSFLEIFKRIRDQGDPDVSS